MFKSVLQVNEGLARLLDVALNVAAVAVPVKVDVVPSKLPVSVPPAKGSLVSSATVILAEPSKLTPLIVRAVCSVVAVVALPLRAAVIVPAEKLPLASRATTLLAVFAEVASTAQVVAAEPLKLEPVR